MVGKSMNVLKKILSCTLIAGAAFFVVSFTVYFFNIDMKLTSAVEPLLIKHYDNMPRKHYI